MNRVITVKRIITTVTMVSLAAMAFADILYVDNNMNDGFWQDSFENLQSALSAARSGDEIWVATGTYTPGVNRDDSFVLKEGVKLYGGFYGGEALLEERDPYANETILSGNIGNLDNKADNSYHVVYGTGNLTTMAFLDGFVIRDGYADNGTGGAGLLLENGASPVIRKCRFYANESSGSGGAVSLENNVLFEYCLFESNTASRGGAVAAEENKNQNGISSFDHCTFVMNSAATGSALYYGKRESFSVENSIFWKNANASSQINSFYSDSRAGGMSSVINSAVDDASVQVRTTFNILYYSSQQDDGPFKDRNNYQVDNDHNIPHEYGWYYVPSPLVLNIKIFLQGPM